jgi:hypothetical protein
MPSLFPTHLIDPSPARLLRDTINPQHSHFRRRVLLRGILTVAAIFWPLTADRLFAQQTLRPRSQLLTSEVSFSFPERIVPGAHGNVYILDTNLSSLFTLDTKSGRIARICGPETLSAPSDIAVDGKGTIWVLSALRSKVSKLTPQCRPQTEIISRRVPLRIETNSFGEVIVLTGHGDALFDVYGSDGKLLRSFGQRLDYQDETANNELSDGHIARDGSGGFFFSFNYPPLIPTVLSEWQSASSLGRHTT